MRKAGQPIVIREAIILLKSDEKGSATIAVKSSKKQRERWQRKLPRDVHETEWADWIQENLTKYGWEIGTFHRMSMEMLGRPCEETFDTKFEEGLWELVSQGRLEVLPPRRSGPPEFRLAREVKAVHELRTRAM